ncbi:MAG TPA: potassium transporter Kup [Rhizomicrobium sp.]|nr:potassium transporter Kup [Rhizomicrobium sp.]
MNRSLADTAVSLDSQGGATSAHAQSASAGRTAALTLGALGVVFGDIGTSPIYAMRETVRATGGALPAAPAVMGALSAIVWALILVVTIKYVLLIMRADNEGEGGVLALAALAHRSPRLKRRVKNVIGVAAILGLALFFGDGMLTPAISVLSAVEGLGVETSALDPFILPLTLAILIGLFALQSRGTAKIGRLFGPIMVVWFLVLAVLGVRGILQAPRVLLAFNPFYAAALFQHAPWTAFVALGAVVLAVTGCEALYADMGHFGKGPIRNAWLWFVLPALLVNYMGQGAALLHNPALAGIPFYGLAPRWAHYPLVLLATVATIIASQAVISGVFSIARQAVQLGRLPRMEIRHTSATDVGQIYVPRMNFILSVGVVLIVLIFHNSSSLAAAYGIAVSGVMAIDTFHASIVATRQWHWSLRAAIALFGTLFLIDLSFLTANSLKVVQGGWLPLLIAGAVFMVMQVWRHGRRVHLEKVRSETMPMDLFLQRADKNPHRVAGTAVFLSPRGDSVPSALLHSLKHYKVLHERVIICHVVVEEIPIVPALRRLEVHKLGKGFFTVLIHHGFFETPDVPRVLETARALGLSIDIATTTFFIGRETLIASQHPKLGRWTTWLYLRLAASALSPARFYQLPPNRVVELGSQIEI